MSDDQSWLPNYVLVFDGGSRNNPGLGYGSYLLKPLLGPSRLRRMEFGGGITNNQAEYQALLEGLRDLITTLEAAGEEPSGWWLEVPHTARQSGLALIVHFPFIGARV